MDKIFETFSGYLIKNSEIVNEGKTIGTLSDEDDAIYLEAKELFKKEYEKFLKDVGPKLKKIVNKSSDKGKSVISSNLENLASTDLIDIYKLDFLK